MFEFLQTTFESLTRGGMMILPIIFCSWIAICIIIERLYNFHRSSLNRKKLMSEMAASLKRRKVIEAVSICDKIPRPLARVVKAGLLKHDRDKSEIKEAMQEAGQEEIIDLERYLPILGTMVYVTPLLGLLGTVMGMIRVFTEIQREVGFANAASLAGGIWEALTTTAAGLAVAIPALIAHNYFVGRTDAFLMDVERAATDLGSLISPKKEI